jgi:spore protease
MNYDNLYTDLACERGRGRLPQSGVDYRRERNINGVWERISITSNEGAKAMGRPVGLYDSLHTRRLDKMDYEEIMGATEELAGELCEMVEKSGGIGTNILVVGLGNQHLTPDATGPESADRVRPTRHIAEVDDSLFSTLGCARISVLKPGVVAKSGIESATAIEGIAREIKPDLVIAIDSLVARGRERLGSTLQISNTGICPGSGLGKAKREISSGTLGATVISIGVPTVINSEALSPGGEGHGKRGEDMLVSPKEVGDIVKNAAEIIGGAINLAFGIFS